MKALVINEPRQIKMVDIPKPVPFGHEWTGVVTEIGPDVTKFRVGDKVVGDGKVTCDGCDKLR